MKAIAGHQLKANQAGLWWLGQAGYVARAGDITLAIDPYLSDSAAANAPEFHRLYPPPVRPEELDVDIFIVTHDHLDHLDPRTVAPYTHKDRTVFVAPHLAAEALSKFGIAPEHITRIDAGETRTVRGATITGVYALPSESKVADTTGYRVEFPNGRSFYHSSDTGYDSLLLSSLPAAEAALVCINGKWGNLNAEQAAELVGRMKPKYAIPNHYDVMALNSENPETFAYMTRQHGISDSVRILKVMEPFVWGGA